jgi:hypothetical protein
VSKIADYSTLELRSLPDSVDGEVIEFQDWNLRLFQYDWKMAHDFARAMVTDTHDEDGERTPKILYKANYNAKEHFVRSDTDETNVRIYKTEQEVWPAESTRLAQIGFGQVIERCRQIAPDYSRAKRSFTVSIRQRNWFQKEKAAATIFPKEAEFLNSSRRFLKGIDIYGLYNLIRRCVPLEYADIRYPARRPQTQVFPTVPEHIWLTIRKLIGEEAVNYRLIFGNQLEEIAQTALTIFKISSKDTILQKIPSNVHGQMANNDEQYMRDLSEILEGVGDFNFGQVVSTFLESHFRRVHVNYPSTGAPKRLLLRAVAAVVLHCAIYPIELRVMNARNAIKNFLALTCGPLIFPHLYRRIVQLAALAGPVLQGDGVNLGRVTTLASPIGDYHRPCDWEREGAFTGEALNELKFLNRIADMHPAKGWTGEEPNNLFGVPLDDAVPPYTSMEPNGTEFRHKKAVFNSAVENPETNVNELPCISIIREFINKILSVIGNHHGQLIRNHFTTLTTKRLRSLWSVCWGLNFAYSLSCAWPGKMQRSLRPTDPGDLELLNHDPVQVRVETGMYWFEGPEYDHDPRRLKMQVYEHLTKGWDFINNYGETALYAIMAWRGANPPPKVMDIEHTTRGKPFSQEFTSLFNLNRDMKREILKPIYMVGEESFTLVPDFFTAWKKSMSEVPEYKALSEGTGFYIFRARDFRNPLEAITKIHDECSTKARLPWAFEDPVYQHTLRKNYSLREHIRKYAEAKPDVVWVLEPEVWVMTSPVTQDAILNYFDTGSSIMYVNVNAYYLFLIRKSPPSGAVVRKMPRGDVIRPDRKALIPFDIYAEGVSTPDTYEESFFRTSTVPGACHLTKMFDCSDVPLVATYEASSNKSMRAKYEEARDEMMRRVDAYIPIDFDGNNPLVPLSELEVHLDHDLFYGVDDLIAIHPAMLHNE